MKSFLALGDSYTIGEGVDAEKSWPHQLVKKLGGQGFLFNSPKIIAKTGWRTDELIAAIDEDKPSKVDYVSLLIGVNNQYQKKPFDQFEKELDILIVKASELALQTSFLLTIPDYGITPFGGGEKQITADIVKYNSLIKSKGESYQIPVVDIYPSSLEVVKKTSLLASDDLHPSGEMYTLWVKEILKSEVFKI